MTKTRKHSSMKNKLTLRVNKQPRRLEMNLLHALRNWIYQTAYEIIPTTEETRNMKKIILRKWYRVDEYYIKRDQIQKDFLAQVTPLRAEFYGQEKIFKQKKATQENDLKTKYRFDEFGDLYEKLSSRNK